MKRLAKAIAPYRKAVGGFLASLIGALGAAMLDGDLTRVETVGALGVGLVTVASVYIPRNGPQDH